MKPDLSHIKLTPVLIDEITEIVFGPADPPTRPCDMIFVFGGTHPGLWETAAKAYHAGLGKKVLATGGWKRGVQHHATWQHGEAPEAQVIKLELIQRGVPEDVIVCEDTSTNSLENVLFAKQVYDFSSIESILVVCKNYGCGRQCRTLQQHVAPTTTLIPHPFDTNVRNGPFITRDTWMDYPQGRQVVLTQLVKIQRYGAMNHLVPLEGVSGELTNLETLCN